MVHTDYGIQPWGLDPELRFHIENCPCSCDHMGYGNFLNYQIPPCPRQLSVHEASFGLHPNYENDIYYTASLDSCSCSSTSSTATKSSCGSWCLCLLICTIVATIAVGLSLPFALNPQRGQTLEERLERIHRLLKVVPLIDGHNDLPWNLRNFLHNKLSTLNLSTIKTEPPWSVSPWSQTDLPRLKAGVLGAVFWSAYVPCKAQDLDAVQVTLEQIDVINRLVERNPRYLALARSSEELLHVHKEGRIASLIGVEGGHALGNSLAVLRTFYNLGVRYLTLTHACDTPWATGSNSLHQNTGLSSFGRVIIKEMNRLGMIVDLSHTSTSTAKAAINASLAPVIFSHSNAYSLCNSSRNVPDDVLKLIASKGGIVMVNFYTHLLTCTHNASLSDVIKHINYIRNITGVYHVGIGAGYDGINVTPNGLEDVSKYPHLLAELLADPVWSESDISHLAGLNLLRVLEQVEQIRDKWRQANIPPAEDSPPQRNRACSTIYS